MKVLASAEELAHTDNLLAAAEAALAFQHEQLTATHVSLVSVDASCEQLREAINSTEADASDLRRRLSELSTQSAIDFSLAQSHSKATSALFETAAKIYSQRELDAKPMAEQQRAWEKKMRDWRDAGAKKTIDPIIFNVNRGVFERVEELFGAEAFQREQHASYVYALDTSEGDRLREALEHRVAALSAQHSELLAQRADFGEALSAALTSYLRDALTGNVRRGTKLELEHKRVYERLRDGRASQERSSQARRASCAATLAPLLAHAGALESQMAEIDAEKELLRGDARQLMMQQQRAIEAAQQGVKRERQRRERLQADLQWEAQAHSENRARLEARSGELTSQSMEFGEKEYFMATIDQLRRARKDRKLEMRQIVSALEQQHAGVHSATRRAEEEIEELKQSRMTMALSLAQYASLEAEWGVRDAEAAEQIAEATSEYKQLKRAAAKLPELEAQMALATKHGDARALRASLQALQTKLDETEAELASVIGAKEAYDKERAALRAEAAAVEWQAAEEAKAREEDLQRQATRLKEGLAKRVMRQWLLQYVALCFKSWNAYVVRRHLQRDLHMPLSDDEEPPAHPLVEGLTSVAAGIAAIPNLF